MPNRMNHDQLFVMNEFVDNPVVTDSQLEQSFKLPCEGFELKLRQIVCQPMYSLDDSPGHRLVQSCQVL